MDLANNRHYLDFAASAPMRQAAKCAMDDYAHKPWADANPNSLHTSGRQAYQALETARSTIARALGGSLRPADVTFTGGGTEANNLAVIGIAEGMRTKDRHRTRVVISAIEHDSILELVSPLKQRGFAVDVVRPCSDGVVAPGDVEALMGPDVALVSVMAANNETGVIQPIGALAAATHKCGAKYHTDAVQAFGRVALDLANVDALSATAHKIGGPVGCGILVIRGRVPFRPQVFGGGQELGRRPGTQDVTGAVGFAAAATDCMAHLDERSAVTASLRARLVDRLGQMEGITLTIAKDTPVVAGTVSLLVAHHDSQALVLKLDELGYEVSAGSACASGSLDPSHVLSAMGISRDAALGSLRVSFDDRVAPEVLDGLCDALESLV